MHWPGGPGWPGLKQVRGWVYAPVWASSIGNRACDHICLPTSPCPPFPRLATRPLCPPHPAPPFLGQLRGHCAHLTLPPLS